MNEPTTTRDDFDDKDAYDLGWDHGYDHDPKQENSPAYLAGYERGVYCRYWADFEYGATH